MPLRGYISKPKPKPVKASKLQNQATKDDQWKQPSRPSAVHSLPNHSSFTPHFLRAFPRPALPVSCCPIPIQFCSDKLKMFNMPQPILCHWREAVPGSRNR